MPIAVNHDTGEVVYLNEGGQWVPAKRAVNPQTKQMLAFDGKDWSPIPSKGKGVLGYVNAAMKGLESGVSFGFSPEIAGGAAKAGLEEAMPYLTDEQVKDVEKAGGTESAYTSARDAERSAQKEAREEYPGTYLTGEVGGALAVPIGAGARGATMAGRVARSAAVGSGAGALSGVGHGDTAEDRIAGGLVGGVVGAAGGTAAPVVEGAIQGARAVAPRIVNEARRLLRPQEEAERQVATAIERDMAADPTARARLTPGEFVEGRNSGQPVRVMDMGGDLTRRLADVAGIVSPEGRTALNEAINTRFETQSPRMAAWLNKTFNFPDAQGWADAIEQTSKAVNKAAYAKAYRDGVKGLWSPELERLAGSDAVSAAMQRAAKNAKDEAIVSGYGAMNPRITFTQDGRIQFTKGPNGVPTYPDLQFWDLTRRELSDAARRAGPGTSEARRLNNFASSLNKELDSLVPAYNAARRGASAFFGAENALQAGQNFVGASERYGLPAAAKAISQMSPTERKLFQDGYVSRLVEKIEKNPDRRSVLNQIARSPAAQKELRIAIGPEKARELEARLRVEGIMDLARSAVQGNSWTARRLFDLGLGGTGMSLVGAGGWNTDPKEMTVGAVMAGLAAGRRHVDANVMRKVAELLVSDDPTKLVRGVRIVARNERLFEGLRAADQRIALAAGEQGAKVPALQAPSAARADQDQDKVQRPQGQ